MTSSEVIIFLYKGVANVENNKGSVHASKDGPIELSKEYMPLINALVAAGYISDISITDEKWRNAKQTAAKRAYHNTEMLLNNYRNFAWMIKYYPNNIANELEMQYESTEELFRLLDLECAKGNKKLEGRLLSYFPTKERFDRLNAAISALQYKPKNGKKLYTLIYMRYVSEADVTVDDIMRELNIGHTQYARYRKKAIELISLWLWGAEDSEKSLMLESLELLRSNTRNNNSKAMNDDT